MDFDLLIMTSGRKLSPPAPSPIHLLSMLATTESATTIRAVARTRTAAAVKAYELVTGIAHIEVAVWRAFDLDYKAVCALFFGDFE